VTKSPTPRIYTKTGDTGDTGLFDGTRVQKSDPRVDAYGEVDELAACLGLARSHLAGDADLGDLLGSIQRTLFALGARLADPRHKISERVGKAALGETQVRGLEEHIDRLERELPPLRHFILSGGSAAGATLHLARAVCRRAERRVVGLGEAAVDPVVIVYLNRLSDLLFVMARVANARAGAPEVEW
jgi:cob(I)alamin adenosyltransferase